MLNSQENVFCFIFGCLLFTSSLSNGITEMFLNSTEPYLNLCSLFGNDLVQLSYLDSIKGLTMCFSTSIPSSTPPPKSCRL